MKMSNGKILCCYAILASLCIVPWLHAAPAPALSPQQQQQQQQQHLSIGVEGDTPTLIVTSAEIGLTPELLPGSATPTSTSTSASTMTARIQVEGKSAATTKTASIKNDNGDGDSDGFGDDDEDNDNNDGVDDSDAIDGRAADRTTPLPKTTTKTPLSVRVTPKAVRRDNDMRTTAMPDNANDAKVKQTKILQMTTTNEARATPTATVTATGTATIASTLPTIVDVIDTGIATATETETDVALNTSKIIAVAGDNRQLPTADKVPATTATDMPVKTTTTTTTALTTKTTIVAATDAATNSMPTNFVPIITSNDDDKPTKLMPMATIVAVTKNDNDNIDAAAAAAVGAAFEINADAVDSQLSTSSSSFVVAYDDEILTIDRPQQSESIARTQTLTTPTTKTTTTTTTTKTPKIKTKQANVGGVKLIDLEQTNTNSPLAANNNLRRRAQQIGHDGHKETKKKQLAELNFVNAADAPTTTTTTTTTTTSAPITTTTTLLAGRHATRVPAELMPVHNGYLGPIFMNEKTFSVVHPLKKPLAQQQQQQKQQQQRRQHQQQHKVSSIEEQLRDGRLVEIIAPTALLEQTPSTSTLRTSMGVVTTPPLTTTERMSNMPNSRNNNFESFGSVHAPPVLSTTVFQVAEMQTSTTKQPGDVKNKLQAATNADLRTESKISDIQIEVYDSTVDSIVASTNFKDNNEGYFALPLEATVGTTRPPVVGVTQERFTQYVIDRADVSTQESSVSPLNIAAGKPEPAAIEIHINVSEGFGNESEDLEFSYRQPDYNNNNNNNHNAAKAMKSLSGASIQSGSLNSKERSDEILVVEIIDTGDNMTENSASSEHINPIFTFRADTDAADVELKDVKYVPPEAIVRPPQVTDELFMADVKGVVAGQETSFPAPPPPPPPPPRKPSIDRDSDTIFYISNTEVKVGESLPTQKPTTLEQQQQQQLLRKSRLENQFFPVNYSPAQVQSLSNGGGGIVSADAGRNERHRYEEDIILSPLRNTADALKIFRSQSRPASIENAPPLDVTYVGESVIEVEQSGNGASQLTTTHMPDVIIQPAILPEMSIGVPVIGELPPQIELKEIDFMPGELTASQGIGGGLGGSNIYENELDDHADNSIAGGVYYNSIGGGGVGVGGVGTVAAANEHNRLLESSIQYGGDLIDDGAGGGFDGIEGSYPFENPANIHHKQQSASAAYVHFNINHGVNNLRKDELSAELPSSLVSGNDAGVGIGLSSEGTPISLMRDNNATMLAQQRIGNDNESLAMLNADINSNNNNNNSNNNNNATHKQTERGAGNATAYSVEEPSNFISENGYLNLFAVSVGLVIIILPVLLFVSVFCAVRHFLQYKQRNNSNDEQNSEEGAAGAKDKNTPKEAIKVVASDDVQQEQLSSSSSSPNCNKQQILNTTSTTTTTITTTTTTMTATTNDKQATTTTTRPEPTKTTKSSKAQITIDLSKIESVHEATIATSQDQNQNHNQNHNNETNDDNDEVDDNDENEDNNYYAGPNGSVTKMTLRDNHLIIVTEERNDISRNARETKMHTDKDGVFVVEVSRGIDSTQALPDSPSVETTELPFDTKSSSGIGLASVLSATSVTSPSGAAVAATRGDSSSSAIMNGSSLHDAAVQIHAPPMDVVAAAAAEELQRSLHLIEEVEEEPAMAAAVVVAERIDHNNAEALVGAVVDEQQNEQTLLAAGSVDGGELEPLRQCLNTGLSQSDLSTTSSSDSNKRYSYGNQELYIIEQSGYATTSPTATQLIVNRTDDNIMQDDNDRRSENGNSLEHTPANAKAVEMELPSNAEKEKEKVEEVEAVKQDDDDEKEKKKQIVVADNQLNDNQLAEERHEQLKSDKENIEQQTAAAAAAQNGAEIPQNINENFNEPNFNAPEGDNNVDPKANNVGDDGAATGEQAFDSIMSLPDPPSNEEMIIQLNEFTLIESNQLDSLPPPPPPLMQQTGDSEVIDAINGNNGKCVDGHDIAEATETLTNGNVLPEQQFTTTTKVPAPVLAAAATTKTTTTTAAAAPATAANEKLFTTRHPPANMNDISNGKLVPSTLTPPASPPASPASNGIQQTASTTTSSSSPSTATLYGSSLSNGVGVNAGLCAPLPAVAVDVNGS